MSRLLLFFAILFFAYVLTSAQESSAIVEFESTNQGVLIPRMTSSQRMDISFPARSLMVYDLNTQSYWYFDQEWKELSQKIEGPEEQENRDGQFFEFELYDVLQLNNPGMITETTQISVCLDITHSDVGYLEIGLIQNGVYIPLSIGNGGSGDDFTQTCFTNASTTYLSDSNPPYTGNFQPDGSFYDLIGNKIAGTWTLVINVTEEFAWNGFLNSWSVLVDPGTPTYAKVLADGNRDTKIQVEELPNENKIRFDIAGEEKMIMNTEGQLGIGTSNPSAPLTISNAGEASIHLNRSGAVSSWSQNSQGSRLTLKRLDGDDAIEFKTFGDSYISGGSLGIGTRTPLERFHLFSSDPTILLTPRNTSNATSSEVFFAEDEMGKSGMRWRYDGTTNQMQLWGYNGIDRNLQNNIFYGNLIMTVERDQGLTTFNASNPSGHVMKITNTSSQPEADGIEIKLGVHPLILDQRNDFITFTDANGTAGRIEGKVTITQLLRPVVNNLLGPTPSVPEAIEDPANHGTEDRDAVPNDFFDNTEDDAVFSDLLDSDYGMALLEYTIDVVQSIITYSINVVGAIAGVALLGDVDDVIWAGGETTISLVKLAAFIVWEEKAKGITFESGGADYAEWLRHADPKEKFRPGQIVGVKGGFISHKFPDPDRYMVVSSNPIVVGNMPEDDSWPHTQVAFIGQTPVQLLGPVNIGDYILPSGNGDGYGIAKKPEQMHIQDYPRIVGVSWTDGDSTQLINIINVAVGINSNDLTNTVVEMQSQINRLQKAMQRIDPSFPLELFQLGDHSTSQSIPEAYKTNEVLAQELVFEPSVLESQDTRTQILSISNEIMDKLSTQHIDLTMVPQFVEMLQDPSVENAQACLNHYRQVLQRCQNLLGSLAD